jgi:beta-propeller repeat-containing protein
VDLVFYGRGGDLEYDFVVAPGSDPARIRLRVEGAAVRLEASGDLVFSTPLGLVRQPCPVLYQEIAGQRRPIAGGYRLAGDAEVAFHVGDFDHGQPLVIDPVLTGATYLGGSDEDRATDVAVDAAGNAYVVGFTYSPDFPPAGAPARVDEDSADYFVTKLDLAGGRTVYTTFFGGAGSDNSAVRIALDPAGNPTVATAADTGDFPIPGGFQSFKGRSDAYIARLRADGSLDYGTYLGGTGFEGASDVAVDARGIIHVVGGTTSIPGFPQRNPVAPLPLARDAAFVARIDPSAGPMALRFSSYLGGSDLGRASNGASGVDVDGAGNTYVVGTTNASDFPVVNAIQPMSAGGDEVFAAEVDAAGSRLVYSTYLGGTDHERASDVAVDALGNAYVVGFTYSPDFPVTAGASLTSALQGGFVTKLAPGGAGLAYSTYLPDGLDPDASNNRIAVDASGNAHVAAVASPDLSTGGTAFPFVNPLPSPCGVVGGGIVVLKLAADGSALTYATPIGRFASEIGPAGITLDASGTAYVVGTAVRGIGATPDAIQPRSGGGFDGFLVQIADSDAPPPLGASSTPGLRLAFGTYLGQDSSPAAQRVAGARGDRHGGVGARGGRPRRRRRRSQRVRQRRGVRADPVTATNKPSDRRIAPDQWIRIAALASLALSPARGAFALVLGQPLQQPGQSRCSSSRYRPSSRRPRPNRACSASSAGCSSAKEGSRAARVLGPARAGARGRRGAAHGNHHRSLPARTARHEPSPQCAARRLHDHRGAHAEEPPRPCRVVALAAHALGRDDRPADRRARERDPRGAPAPEQGYRSCLGIRRLAKRYDAPRLEAVCARALTAGAHSYRHVAAILKRGLDRTTPAPTTDPVPAHENIRGRDYSSRG